MGRRLKYHKNKLSFKDKSFFVAKKDLVNPFSSKPAQK